MNFSFLKIILLTIFLLILSSCKSQQEEDQKLNISMMIWGSQKLRAPLNLMVSEEIISEFSAENYNIDGLHPVEQMLLNWDKVYPAVQFFQMPTQATNNKNYSRLEDYNDSEMGIYINYDWFPNVSSSALAITQFYGIKRSVAGLGFLELIHADIILNYRNHDFSLSPNDASAYYMPTVLLHEIGHLLGLSHQRDYQTNSIMQPFLSTFDSQTSLTANDVDILINNYNMTPLRNSTSFTLPSRTRQPKDGEIVHGVIELHADGTCRHILNGELTKIHPAPTF